MGDLILLEKPGRSRAGKIFLGINSGAEIQR